MVDNVGIGLWPLKSLRHNLPFKSYFHFRFCWSPFWISVVCHRRPTSVNVGQHRAVSSVSRRYIRSIMTIKRWDASWSLRSRVTLKEETMRSVRTKQKWNAMGGAPVTTNQHIASLMVAVPYFTRKIFWFKLVDGTDAVRHLRLLLRSESVKTVMITSSNCSVKATPSLICQRWVINVSEQTVKNVK